MPTACGGPRTRPGPDADFGNKPSVFYVTAVAPADGALLNVSPTSITVDFNAPLKLTSVDAGDLQLDGVDATGVTVVDADTLRFTVPAPADGTHTVTLAAGALENADGTFLPSFASSFTVDTQPPTVTVDPLATPDPSPPLTGTVNDTAATVRVTVGGQTHTATNRGDGTWLLPDNTINPSLINGIFDVAVEATDAAGNVGHDATGNELTILPSIVVTPTSSLTTTEAGGTATFTIRLGSRPTADVTIGVSSSDTSEGTVSPASVTFTAATWDTPSTLTVTGINDDWDDGDVTYTVVTAAAVSADAGYNNLNAADVTVANTDDDTAGISVDPTSGLTTTEAGGTAAFTIVLQSEPLADVTIALSSSDATEGTVSPASVTFSPGNWNTPQAVTVTGVDDLLIDGNIAYTVVTAPAASGDAGYNGRNPADVAISNTDNDVPGVRFRTAAARRRLPRAGLSDAYSLVLTYPPTADVVVTVLPNTQVTATPSSVVFTAANWNVPQSVTVTAVNDAIAEGAHSGTVSHTAASTDANYNGIAVAAAAVQITDNDVAGIAVSRTSGLVTTEDAGMDTFDVVLTSQPTANVTIVLSSSDTTEGTIFFPSTTLTFTPSNWNTAVTVWVRGAHDVIIDGDVAYTIVTAAATSTDPNYNGMNPPDVSVINRDNDVAGFTISPSLGLVTTEAGGTATFTVKLTAQPAADVTLGLATSDATEGTVSPASLTFTAANWNTAQTVTVTGVDDSLADGDMAYRIVSAAATSTDANFNGVNPADVIAG